MHPPCVLADACVENEVLMQEIVIAMGFENAVV